MMYDDESCQNHNGDDPDDLFDDELDNFNAKVRNESDERMYGCTADEWLI